MYMLFVELQKAQLFIVIKGSACNMHKYNKVWHPFECTTKLKTNATEQMQASNSYW